MNRDELIRLAKEAGMVVVDDQFSMLPFLERFASIVAAHERGNLASLMDHFISEARTEDFRCVLEVCANAIRSGNYKIEHGSMG